MSASRIAAGVGISERHLSRAFGSTDTSVPQYVLTRRLDRAHALLVKAPETPVAEIAARCGFGSATYFSQAFRNRFGMRATDVRQQARSRQSG